MSGVNVCKKCSEDLDWQCPLELCCKCYTQENICQRCKRPQSFIVLNNQIIFEGPSKYCHLCRDDFCRKCRKKEKELGNYCGLCYTNLKEKFK